LGIPKHIERVSNILVHDCGVIFEQQLLGQSDLRHSLEPTLNVPVSKPVSEPFFVENKVGNPVSHHVAFCDEKPYGVGFSLAFPFVLVYVIKFPLTVKDSDDL
jgi:hypothetical protein